MILIRNRMAGWFLSGHYHALCIWPFMLVHPNVSGIELQRTLDHERIHVRQQAELLWIFFFLAYGIEYLIRLVQHRNPCKAYFSIAFEREAYDHEREQGYLKRRKAFAWVKYWLRRL